MATLAENAAAVKAAQVAIDAAIVAKGGTTEGGLNNAAAAIASIPSGGGEPEYPHPWRNDGNTHIWWWFGPNTYPLAYFTAQFISDGHTFTVDWGDGQTETVAASTAFTTRALTHNYAEGGEYEVTIYAADGDRPSGGEDYGGYDKINLNQSALFGAHNSVYRGSAACVRQLELAGDVTGWTSTYAGAGLVAWITPDGAVTSIGNSAFIGCVSLVSVGDLSACTSIGDKGFQYCASLNSIGDLSHLETLGLYAFHSTSSLKSLPDMPNLTTVGQGVFGASVIEHIGDMPKLKKTSGGDGFLLGNTTIKTIGDLSSLETVSGNFVSSSAPVESMTFRNKTHTEVMAITGFTYFPNRGQACVFHCSDGDFYRSGTSLLPMPTEG